MENVTDYPNIFKRVYLVLQLAGLLTTEGKKTFGRHSRSGDNIKMNVQEVEWVGMDWTDLAQDRYRWRGLVNAVMNLRVP
jgi:hypothetical protein